MVVHVIFTELIITGRETYPEKKLKYETHRSSSEKLIVPTHSYVQTEKQNIVVNTKDAELFAD